MDKTNKTERATFEEWAAQQKNKHGLPYFLILDPLGDRYVDESKNDAWAGWQAAIAVRGDEVKRLQGIYESAVAGRAAFRDALRQCQAKLFARDFEIDVLKQSINALATTEN